MDGAGCVMRELGKINVEFDSSSKEFRQSILKNTLNKFIEFYRDEYDFEEAKQFWQDKVILVPKKKTDYIYSRMTVTCANLNENNLIHTDRIVIIREDRICKDDKYRFYRVYRDKKAIMSFRTKSNNASEEFGRMFKSQLDELNRFRIKHYYRDIPFISNFITEVSGDEELSNELRNDFDYLTDDRALMEEILNGQLKEAMR